MFISSFWKTSNTGLYWTADYQIWICWS